MSLAVPPASQPSYPKDIEIISRYDPEEAERLRKAIDTIRRNPDLIRLLAENGVPVYSIWAAILVSRYVSIKGKPRIMMDKLVKHYRDLTGYETVPTLRGGRKPDLVYIVDEIYRRTVLPRMFAKMIHEAGLTKTFEEAMRLVKENIEDIALERLRDPGSYFREVIEAVKRTLSYYLIFEEAEIKIEDGKITIRLPWDTIEYTPKKITPYAIGSDIAKLMREKGYTVYGSKPAIRKKNKIIVYPEGKVIEVKEPQKTVLNKEIEEKLAIGDYTYEIYVSPDSGSIDIHVYRGEHIAKTIFFYTVDGEWPRDFALKLASAKIPMRHAEKILRLLSDKGLIPPEEIPGLITDLKIGYKVGRLLRSPRRSDELELFEAEYIGLLVSRTSPAGDYALLKYPDKTRMFWERVLVDGTVRDRFITSNAFEVLVRYKDKYVMLPRFTWRIFSYVKPDRVYILLGARATILDNGEEVFWGGLYGFEKDGRIYVIERPY